MTPAEALEQVRAWANGHLADNGKPDCVQAREVLAILDSVTPDAPVTVERAYFQVASVHHLHDGRHCLCGFDSHGRARSATEHILDEYRAALTPATPERAEQEREAAVERAVEALRPWLLGLGTLTLSQVNDLAPKFAHAAVTAYEVRGEHA